MYCRPIILTLMPYVLQAHYIGVLPYVQQAHYIGVLPYVLQAHYIDIDALCTAGWMLEYGI